MSIHDPDQAQWPYVKQSVEYPRSSTTVCSHCSLHTPQDVPLSVNVSETHRQWCTVQEVKAEPPNHTGEARQSWQRSSHSLQLRCLRGDRVNPINARMQGTLHNRLRLGCVGTHSQSPEPTASGNSSVTCFFPLSWASHRHTQHRESTAKTHTVPPTRSRQSTEKPTKLPVPAKAACPGKRTSHRNSRCSAPSRPPTAWLCFPPAIGVAASCCSSIDLLRPLGRGPDASCIRLWHRLPPPPPLVGRASGMGVAAVASDPLLHAPPALSLGGVVCENVLCSPWCSSA